MKLKVIIFLLVLTLGLVLVAKAEEYTDNEICHAIYQAEGGAKASKPYGILSVHCDGVEDCRVVCMNTIRNNRRRYANYGKDKFDTYLEFLSSRYAPIGAENDPTGLNKNWLKNVKYFLNEGNYNIAIDNITTGECTQEAFCDSCGKDLVDHETCTSLVGMQLSIDSTREMDGPYQKQMGVYKLGKQYKICWECWLKSLGAKP